MPWTPEKEAPEGGEREEGLLLERGRVVVIVVVLVVIVVMISMGVFALGLVGGLY